MIVIIMNGNILAELLQNSVDAVRLKYNESEDEEIQGYY